jgi:hypothetical protein
MKKCPPGVICIENVSLFFVIVSIFIIGLLMYISLYKQNVVVNSSPSEKIIITNTQRENSRFLPNWPYFTNDVLLNPYVPPLRDERIPINISTNIGAVDTNYRQVGILTATNSKGKILPLMGRPIFTNRDKWQYYTMSDQHNSIKLPVSRNGKSCTNEYGCDRLYNNDTVYIEGVNEAYRVTMYDNDTIKYLPL